MTARHTGATFVIGAALILLNGTVALAQATYPAFYDPAQAPNVAKKTGITELVLKDSPVPDLVAGSKTEMTFTFTNPGLVELRVSSFDIVRSPGIEISEVVNGCTEEPVMPATSCEVSMQMEVRAANSWRLEFVIRHDGPERISKGTVEGTARPQTRIEAAAVWPSYIPGKGILIADRELIDMQNAQSGSAVSLPLVNEGDMNLEISDIRVTDGGPFEVVTEGGNSTCRRGTVLKPDSACALSVRVKKNTVGLSTDTVQIEHSGLRGILLLPIRAEVPVSEVAATPSQEVLNSLLPKGAAQPGSVSSKVSEPSAPTAPVAQAPGLDSSKFRVSGIQKGKRAVVQFPDGKSRIIREGQSFSIAGTTYRASVGNDRVVLNYGENKKIALYFDNSFVQHSDPKISATSSEGSQ